MSELLTVGDVARMFQVSKITVHRWKENGELRFIKLGPGSVRFRPEDVEDFIRRSEQERRKVQ